MLNRVRDVYSRNGFKMLSINIVRLCPLGETIYMLNKASQNRPNSSQKIPWSQLLRHLPSLKILSAFLGLSVQTLEALTTRHRL